MAHAPTAVKINGLIYVVGKSAPKPMDLKDSTLKHGGDGIVAKIADSGGITGISFEDGDKFILANMPTVYYYASGEAIEPNNETAAGVVPAEA